jgi:hypothetical protein
MTFRIVRRLLLSSGILLLPVVAYAQEATFTGTVTDSTGGVLPGVIVTAVLEATGNTFAAVTDDRGVYRIPARVGAYKVAAELQGFTTVVREGLQLLVGETLVVNLQLSPSTLAETITVTAEAPLLNVSSSVLGSNIDPKQVQDMPLQGVTGARCCCWPREPHHQRHGRANQFEEYGQDPGVSDQRRRPAVSEHDGRRRPADVQPGDDRGVPVHLQPVRRHPGPFLGSPGQPRHEVWNQPLRRIVPSNFRDDRFNAPDPILDRVTPIQNQQYARRLAAPSCATGCTSSRTTSTSASRKKRRGERRTRNSTSPCRGRPGRRSAAAASITRSRRRAG